jgi:uncharacterized protein (DUF1697 family)
MVTYVALLRGINVGGKTSINMARLKECFEEQGFLNVKTYINSGNVIFNTSSSVTVKLEQKIEKAIIDNFNFPVKVMVRSMSQMEDLIKNIPKSWGSNKEFRYNVIFLSHAIDNTDLLNDLHPKPNMEELRYYPGVLFWSAKTSDLTKTGMLKVNRMPIYKEMTVRGLNTTLKIYGLMQEANK